MDYEDKMNENGESEEVSRRGRHNMAPGQKLTLDDIRQTVPDSTQIIHNESDLRPERHFGLIVIKDDKKSFYKDEELDLSAEEMATLKREFEVSERSVEGLPSPAAMALAKREWEEWEKINGPRPRFTDKSS